MKTISKKHDKQILKHEKIKKTTIKSITEKQAKTYSNKAQINANEYMPKNTRTKKHLFA